MKCQRHMVFLFESLKVKNLFHVLRHEGRADSYKLKNLHAATKTQQSRTNNPAGTDQLLRLWQETNRTSFPCGAFFPWGNSNEEKEESIRWGWGLWREQAGWEGVSPMDIWGQSQCRGLRDRYRPWGQKGAEPKQAYSFFKHLKKFLFVVGCAGSSLLPAGFLVGASRATK